MPASAIFRSGQFETFLVTPFAKRGADDIFLGEGVLARRVLELGQKYAAPTRRAVSHRLYLVEQRECEFVLDLQTLEPISSERPSADFAASRQPRGFRQHLP
jgi:hypothetical protein